MTVQPQTTTVTEFEEFIKRPENMNRRFELIQGDVVELSPTVRHGVIVGLLMGYLFNYLNQNPIGRGVVEGRYRLPTDNANSLIPDLSFIHKDREVTEDGAAPYMPDFVVEVKSPDDTFLEMREKAIYYLKHGCQLVWLVFPSKHEVEVHTLERIQTFGLEEILEGGDVLPGFHVAVKDIFNLSFG